MIALRSFARRLGPAAAALALAGCTTVGPDYQAPALPAGLAQSAAAPFEATDGIAVSSQPLPDRWWKLYDDPRLDALVAEALAANTDLRVAAASLERARAYVREVGAVAGIETALDGGGDYLRPSGQASHLQYDGGIGISYEVDVVGRIRRSLEAAEASAGAEAAAYDLARITIVADLVGAYTDACSAGARIDVARRSLDLQQQSLALTSRGVRAGIFPPLEQTRSAALVEQLAAAVPPLEASRRVALYRLAVLTGHAPTDFPAELSECHAIPALERPIPAGDGAALIARRPDIRRAERELAAATAQVGVATAALYPDVRLGASLGSTARGIGGLADPSSYRFSLGPLISWSFPNRSVARTRIDQADAASRGALAQFDGTVLNALREAESALTVYVRDLQENERLGAARDLSREAAQAVARMRRGGAASGLEALDVERTLASAEAALIASEARLASDRVAVFLALGGGWEEST